MGKTIQINPNADLPPLMVLSPYLIEKKREFVTKKLHDFGLVRKEIFDRKLGHKRKDFPLKKFFAKRYRYVTAPMTDEEVEQLLNTIQSLMTLTPKPETSQTLLDSKLLNPNVVPAKSNSLLSVVLVLLSAVALGGGLFAAYQVYISTMSLAFELAIVLASGSFLVAIMFLAIAQILKLLKSIR
jgi:hypothetical protein